MRLWKLDYVAVAAIAVFSQSGGKRDGRGCSNISGNFRSTSVTGLFGLLLQPLLRHVATGYNKRHSEGW